MVESPGVERGENGLTEGSGGEGEEVEGGGVELAELNKETIMHMQIIRTRKQPCQEEKDTRYKLHTNLLCILLQGRIYR